MESEVKLVDLSRENLNTVKEAIKIASGLGPAGFKFFVSKNFIRNGLVVTKIVPLSGDAPPKSQLLMRFGDLKNLKNAVDFAKKVLVNNGEAIVEEKAEPIIHATAAVEEMVTETTAEVTIEAEATPVAEDSSEVQVAEAPKKRGRKKTTALDEADIAEIADPEEGAE